MNTTPADSLAQRLPQQLDLSQRHTWQPAISGDIDIVIDRNSRWFHCGDPFTREKIERLFCQLLRREEGDEYFLVTPVEKWRITVEAAPLRVIAMEIGQGQIQFACNDGSDFLLGPDHSIQALAHSTGALPVIAVRDGLCALIERHYYYRLAEEASWESEQAWIGTVGAKQLLPTLE